MRMQPCHPGAMIQECYIEELGLTGAELAKGLDVSPSTIGRVVQQKASITPDMAVRLERVLGGSAKMWLGMQSAYDLWNAENNNPHLELNRLAVVDEYHQSKTTALIV